MAIDWPRIYDMWLDISDKERQIDDLRFAIGQREYEYKESCENVDAMGPLIDGIDGTGDLKVGIELTREWMHQLEMKHAARRALQDAMEEWGREIRELQADIDQRLRNISELLDGSP